MKTIPILLAFFLATGMAYAAGPVAITSHEFVAPVFVDFSGLTTNGEPVSTQLSGQGITFSGNAYASNVGGFFGGPGVTNIPGSGGMGPFGTIVLTFSSPIIRIGMDVVTNTGAFYVSTSDGTVPYPVPPAIPFFVGYQDLAGFTSVTLLQVSQVNDAFGFAHLIFERAGSPCTFSINPPSASVGSGSGTTGQSMTGTFTFTATTCDANNTWTAVSDSPRLLVTSGASGNGATATATIG